MHPDHHFRFLRDKISALALWFHGIMRPDHRFRFLRENWYRDVWLLVVSGLVLWSSLSTFHTQQDQVEGRRVSLGATCAAVSSVIEAGRATILGGVVIKPDSFRHNLEHIGLPPVSVRRTSAADAAAAYSRAIAFGVARATHKPSLVRDDGTLDCQRLQVVARVVDNP